MAFAYAATESKAHVDNREQLTDQKIRIPNWTVMKTPAELR